MMKLCRGPCGQWKPEREFYAERSRCMECIRAVERARYWRTRETRLAAANAYWRRTQQRSTADVK